MAYCPGFHIVIEDGSSMRKRKRDIVGVSLVVLMRVA